MLIPFPEAKVRAKAISSLGLRRTPFIPNKAVYFLKCPQRRAQERSKDKHTAGLLFEFSKETRPILSK